VTIEQDFETVRDRANALAARVDKQAFPGDAEKLEDEIKAALSRIEADRQEAWRVAQEARTAAGDAGLRADRNSDYVAKLHTQRDALQAALEEIAYRDGTLYDARFALKELE